jgi:hypothetical protein
MVSFVDNKLACVNRLESGRIVVIIFWRGLQCGLFARLQEGADACWNSMQTCWTAIDAVATLY